MHSQVKPEFPLSPVSKQSRMNAGLTLEQI